MPEKKSENREKVKEIVAGIEAGIKDLFQSEQYADYLRTMSRFHSYSYRNTILIHMQRPDATLVAGFTKWKKQFQRHVKKGEKGITILAPTPYKMKIEEKKIDPETLSPVRDEDGNIVTEEKTVEIPMFRPVKVFDVKQTDGKPLPNLSMDLTGNVQHYEAFLEALCRTSPVPIDFKPIDASMDGCFSPARQRIAIQDGMSEIQTVCTVVHEITHAVLHNHNQEQQAAAAGTGEAVKPKDEQTQEVEAESVAYAVCQYYGIETRANSLGYIASWSSGKELPELKASLETISKTADFLITNIDRHFAEICKEQGIVLESPELDVPAAEEPDSHELETQSGYVLTMEDNPRCVGDVDRHLIRARKADDQELNPEQVLFIGSASVCGDLLGQLQRGELRPDDFFHVSTACVSRYVTKDGAQLDAFAAMDDKVYLGLRDHYDNRGHYINHDKSLLQVSDHYQMFQFLSSTSYTETQSEMLEEGFFTQENYAEYAALQVGVLAQFVETEPLMFADKPFCLTPAEEPEINQEALPVEESQELQEALYLVDDAAYLHFRTSGSGYDFTLYDRDTMRRIDSGQTVVLSVTKPSPVSLREAAAMAIRDCIDLEGNSIVDVPLEKLEELREAAARDTTLDEYPMPDPQYAKEELARDYGYAGDDMLPVSQERAAELLERDFTIYAVVDGGTLEMVFNKDELGIQPERPFGRVFAVPCEEWEASPDFQEAVADRMNHQEERKQAFLDHAGDCFAIYQIKDGDEQRDLRYMSMDWLISKGLTAERCNYDLVYTGEMAPGQGSSALEKLWVKFNEHHPADYHRPSLSVSDIIALKQDGVISCHYCDSFGYAKVPDFIRPENYLKSAELSMEDDCNMIDGIINNGPKEPSVAELEAQAKSGQQISLMDLAGAIQRERGEKKKSVVAQLKGKTVSEHSKTTRKKNQKKER